MSTHHIKTIHWCGKIIIKNRRHICQFKRSASNMTAVSFSISLFLYPICRSVLMLLLLFRCISKIRLYIEHAHRTFIHTQHSTTSSPHYFLCVSSTLTYTQYDSPITFLMAEIYKRAKRNHSHTYANITRIHKKEKS